MASEESSEPCIEGEYLGCLEEASYKTPTPSTPDTCVTSTLSCISSKDSILWGDYEMEECRGLPQLTLGIIKPDGMKFIHDIEKRLRDEGFDVVQKRVLRLSPEQASDFYYEHYGRPYFPILVASICEGPLQVFVLRRSDAVAMWRMMCGPPCVSEAKKRWPDTLRAIYGVPDQGYRNICHAAETEEKAREEIRFFFPSMVLDDNFKSELEVEDYIKEWVNPTLLEGLTQLCKNKPLDPILWLASWLLTNNPFKPKLAEKIALTPT